MEILESVTIPFGKKKKAFQVSFSKQMSKVRIMEPIIFLYLYWSSFHKKCPTNLAIFRNAMHLLTFCRTDCFSEFAVCILSDIEENSSGPADSCLIWQKIQVCLTKCPVTLQKFSPSLLVYSELGSSTIS